MEYRRGFGLRLWALALLLAASAMGAGCSSAPPAAGADSGGADVGKTDGSMPEDTGTLLDTGVTVDTGLIDAGAVTDAGDSGTVADTGATDAGTLTDTGVGDGGTDGGATRRLHAGASLVSAGSLMRSSQFQMISTLGGRSVQQTTLQSPNFRLRGGLVGTIGAR